MASSGGRHGSGRTCESSRRAGTDRVLRSSPRTRGAGGRRHGLECRRAERDRGPAQRGLAVAYAGDRPRRDLRRGQGGGPEGSRLRGGPGGAPGSGRGRGRRGGGSRGPRPTGPGPAAGPGWRAGCGARQDRTRRWQGRRYQHWRAGGGKARRSARQRRGRPQGGVRAPTRPGPLPAHAPVRAGHPGAVGKREAVRPADDDRPRARRPAGGHQRRVRARLRGGQERRRPEQHDANRGSDGGRGLLAGPDRRPLARGGPRGLGGEGAVGGGEREIVRPALPRDGGLPDRRVPREVRPPALATDHRDPRRRRPRQGDRLWEPLLVTPPHPDYPSAHATFSGAAEAVLRTFFGRDDVDVSVTYPAPLGITRTYKTFSAITAEVDDARVWGGIHFRSADHDGSELGRLIGAVVMREFPRPMTD